MLAKVISGAVIGLNCVPIEVEIDIASQGLPSFTIVGLPDKAVEESKERVRSALRNTGADFPPKRITVNLAPADLPKEGPAYDLPIALGLLLASDQLKADLSGTLVLGELSLDGSLRHTNGVLPLIILAKEKGFKRVFLPAINAKEAAIVEGVEIYPVENLEQLFHHLNESGNISPHPLVRFDFTASKESEFDMKDVRGQEHAKRAMEICAAGGHNVLLKGPPGAGKTLLARTLPSILPNLVFEEALEVSKIYSVVGQLPMEEPIIKERPFRSPHHTTSSVGLIGGGSHPKPGEISLAHRGVLFLDEFPEFPRLLLEALRQPLEDGFVTVSRAQGTVSFPTKFILVAAANPCPCGFLGDKEKECLCSPSQIIRYQKRISGPILDRIDLHIEVPAVKVEKLTDEKSQSAEDSKTVRERVQMARDIQTKRLVKSGQTCNAEMSSKEVKEFCALDSKSLEIIRSAITQMHLSARSYYRILKIARTIADLAEEENISPAYLAEAIQYRAKEN